MEVFFMARANGEGTIYETIQKIKRKFNNTKMCKICSECKDRSYCNNRTGYVKCDKCINCTSKDCDRFYIYKGRKISHIQHCRYVCSGRRDDSCYQIFVQIKYE